MYGNIVEINDDCFEREVIQADKPVIVDFWAPWCAPCRIISPIIEELAESFENEVKFAKCNVDENLAASARYGIKAIPNLVFFRHGSVARQIIGVEHKSILEKAIKDMLL